MANSFFCALQTLGVPPLAERRTFYHTRNVITKRLYIQLVQRKYNKTLQLQFYQFYLSYNSIRNKETHKLSSFTFYACKNFQIQFKQYETYNRNCFIHENVSKEKLEPRRITIQVNLFSSLQCLLHIKLFHCFKGAVLRQEKTGTHMTAIEIHP